MIFPRQNPLNLFKAPLTGFMRYKQGSFANPEDALVAAKGDADEAKKLMG